MHLKLKEALQNFPVTLKQGTINWSPTFPVNFIQFALHATKFDWLDSETPGSHRPNRFCSKSPWSLIPNNTHT
jgi:hypothetical protein